MEVHVDRDAFMRGLQMAHNVVEPRQTLPVLANVLLEAQADTLKMTATDLEVSVRVTGPAKVVKPGTITISARKLMEIVKELPSAPLALKVQENAWVALRCAGASYRLVGLTPEEFPAVGDGASTGWLTIDGRFTRHAEPDDLAISMSRYALNGVLFAGDKAPDGGHRRTSAGLSVRQLRAGPAIPASRRKAVRKWPGSWVRREVGSRSATTSS
jgi:DNA polymerase-3 subunit beta